MEVTREDFENIDTRNISAIVKYIYDNIEKFLLLKYSLQVVKL